MKRREFFGVLSGIAFLCSTSAFAQQPRKMHRIGVLWHGANVEQEAIYLAALRQGLRDFGYVEGQNIVLEMRFPAEQYERFFVLAAELAQQNVDVLVSAAGIAAVACHRATTTIPIVSVNVPDPVGRKLVASLKPARRKLDRLVKYGRRVDEEAHRTGEGDDQRLVTHGVACKHGR